MQEVRKVWNGFFLILYKSLALIFIYRSSVTIDITVLQKHCIKSEIIFPCIFIKYSVYQTIFHIKVVNLMTCMLCNGILYCTIVCFWEKYHLNFVWSRERGYIRLVLIEVNVYNSVHHRHKISSIFCESEMKHSDGHDHTIIRMFMLYTSYKEPH